MVAKRAISVAPYESATRKMMAQALAEEYLAYPSLSAAREDEDAVLVLEAARGEQIYLTCNVRLVACTVETLSQLLVDLDRVAWSGGDPNEARVLYERHPPGTVLAGGTGGGRVTDGLWIHQQFERFGLIEQIRMVIAGTSAQL
jgi:hypothetical protein